MKDFFNSEHFLLIFTGLVSIAYAWSWIRKILKGPKPYHKRQYFYIALAFLVIILGLSTFFTKFILNCLCGIYAGVSEFINLYQEIVIKKDKNIWNIITDSPNGWAWGLSLITFSIFFTLTLYLE